MTLNILDYDLASSPVSSTRRSSPTSSVSSRSSKRSGGVYDIPADYYPTTTKDRRTPSPSRQHRQLTHIVHPKPRNPMAAHKLTLDTQYNYNGRPDSMISSAATTASPLSDRSSSTCSGSTLSSRGSSPATPMCDCDEYEVDTHGHYCGEYDDEYEYELDESYEYACAPPAGKSVDESLAHRLERGLRM